MQEEIWVIFMLRRRRRQTSRGTFRLRESRVGSCNTGVFRMKRFLPDEPTNNLDPECGEEIVRVLTNYSGAEVLVSNDFVAGTTLNPEKRYSSSLTAMKITRTRDMKNRFPWPDLWFHNSWSGFKPETLAFLTQTSG